MRTDTSLHSRSHAERLVDAHEVVPHVKHSIGTGAGNATVWLNFRNHAVNCGVKRAIYHAYEASRMAASAPTVNSQIEITIATKDGETYLAKDRYYPGKHPISFAELEDLYRKHGPQSTERIEFTATVELDPPPPKDDPSPPQPSPESP